MSGCDSTDSIRRTHTEILPAPSRAANARMWPSGEMAACAAGCAWAPVVTTKLHFSGGMTVNRVTCAPVDRATYKAARLPIVVSTNSAVASFHAILEPRDPRGIDAGG